MLKVYHRLQTEKGNTIHVLVSNLTGSAFTDNLLTLLKKYLFECYIF